VIVAAQLLDGISAATLGVLIPLVIADVTRGSGRFNLAQGAVGAAVGIGASASTSRSARIRTATSASGSVAPPAVAATTSIGRSRRATKRRIMTFFRR